MLKIVKHITLKGENLVAKYRERKIEYPKFFKMDNLCKLGYLACYDLLGGEKFREDNSLIACVMCCRSSSGATDVEFQKTIIDPTNCFASPSIFVYTLPNIVLGEMAIAFDLRGENSCYVVPGIENADFQTKVKQLFDHTNTKIVVCCWVEYGDNEQFATMMLVRKDDEKGVEFNNENVLKIYNDGKSN